MRLICPNCDAQYEVPDDVMPAAGRDVQCSNCGKTWFQHHADHIPADADDEDAFAPDEETAPPPHPTPRRKSLTPDVTDILREEAEAEQAARRNMQSGGLESQPDLGMDMEEAVSQETADVRNREAQERMERLRGRDVPEVQASGGRAPEAAATALGSLGSRRDLLPDIEEINSTLRSGATRTGAASPDSGPEIEAPTHQRKRRGFRTGFLTMLLVFIALMALYITSPRLAVAVPALEAPLSGYVSAVDKGRVWLDGKVQSLLKSLDDMAANSA